MLNNIKKITAGLGLIALCVTPAIAGQFSINTSYGPQSGTAVVPSAGSCGQVCYNAYSSSWATSSGPLGTISLSGQAGAYNQKSGAVAPGSYGCYVTAGSGGYAVVTITW
jgi:hypothetical protein